jgi:Protein of unknown function (DUF3489)
MTRTTKPKTPTETLSDTRRRETKVDILRRLLARKAGADLDALCTATGWQAHSVRAALSGLRKAGFALERTAPKVEGGATVYRITAAPAPAP